MNSMNQTTWIEISQEALDHNISQFKQWLPQQTSIAAVIKANAYGHGIQEMGLLLDQNPNVVALCVANTLEGIQLRLAGVQKRIIVLGFINTPIETIITNNLELFISDIDTANQLNIVAKAYNATVRVHIKIDTGLSRLGFLPADVNQAVDYIQTLSNIHIVGICSHFIEAFNKELVQQQEDILQQFVRPGMQVHIANSNSCLLTKYTYSFARIGAGIYGYLPEADAQLQAQLKPVLSLKTKVIAIKTIPTGASVGYGKTFIAKKETTIAVLGMGYYEGIDPDLFNYGKVLINGSFAPIIGRINMNYFTVDITNIPNVHVHDTVTVLGSDGVKTISGYDWRIGAKKNVRIFLARLNEMLPKFIIRNKNITIAAQKAYFEKNSL